MSIWTDRVRTHAVWQYLQALGPVIDQALRGEDVDVSTTEGLERLRTILAFTGRRLAALDPVLLLQGPLDGIAAGLQNATTEVQQYISSANAGHIVNANSHAESALSHLASLAVLDRPSELEALGSAALSYRSTLEGALIVARDDIADVTAEVEAVRAKFNELTTEIAAERQRLASVVGEFQSQFSTAQESRSTEYLAAQTVRQEKFAALIQDYTTRLTQQDLDSAQARADAQSELDASLTAYDMTFRQKAQGVLDAVDEHRKQVEKLVGVIGNLGVTSGYLKTANRAQVSLWIWQGITVVALGALIFVAYNAFLPLVEDNFTWPGFASRVFLSLTVGVLAAYAASQADKFLNIERRNRKLALELEALGPFLAPLSPEKQQEFRLSVGDRSFGGDDGAGTSGDSSPATVLDLMKSKDFRTFITELVRAGRP